MPSRVHWVYMTLPGMPRFDQHARNSLQQSIRNKAVESMSSAAYERLLIRMDHLPRSFRKAIPALRELAIENGWTFTKKLRSFRLPKRLRKNKNPILSWTKR